MTPSLVPSQKERLKHLETSQKKNNPISPFFSFLFFLSLSLSPRGKGSKKERKKKNQTPKCFALIPTVYLLLSAARIYSVEDKRKRRDCPELPFPGEGEYVVTELFYMRVGTLRLRRRWIDPDAVLRGQVFLTALSALVLLLGGFALGWCAARWSAAAPGGANTAGLGPGFGAGAYYADEYGFGHVTASSWVENVAFGGGGGGGGGCDCNNENMKRALDSLGNNSSSMYY